MAIPNETVEQILQTARIEEVVSEFVTLKKRGTNLIGLCPFHDEKTPSFNVNPARNIFKCFGCGKAGDSAIFIRDIEHISYPDALRYLAKKYNIKIEEKELTPEERMAQTEREKMFNINEFADKYFVDTLWNTEEGRTIGLEYFRERGYFDPIIQKFHLGYSPAQWDAFTVFAKQNGYDPEFLEKVGFSIKRQNDEFYDRFRGRVMFPIHNLTGKVVGFGGRILKTDPEKKLAKYQNSPESEIYQKKQTLYGIYFAKNAIAKQDECILVEGYFDVLRMHQIGIENVVASSGTSLTMEQIRLVKRYTKNITMLYDGDAAGIHAALRGTDMILSEGMNVRVVVLPPEHDPDTFGKEFSVEYVSNYLKENAKDFIRFKTELLLKDAENDPIKRGQVIRDIVETISVIPDSIFRITYVKECSRILDMPEQTLTNELNKILRAKLKKTLGIEDNVVPETDTTTSPKQEETVEDQLPAGYYQERELVKLLLMYGKEMIVDERVDESGETIYEQVSVAQFIIDDLKMDDFQFTNDVNKKIFDIFDHALDEGRIPDDSFFVSHEDETVAERAADLLSTPYKLDRWGRYGIYVKHENGIYYTKKDEESNSSDVVLELNTNMLRITVLSSLYRYKDLLVEERRKAVEEELKTAEDIEDQLILLKKKKDLDDIRKQINEKLGIVIAK